MTPELVVLLERTKAVRRLLREWKGRPVPVNHSRLRSARRFVYFKETIWSSAVYLNEDEWKVICKRKIERDKAKLESIKVDGSKRYCSLFGVGAGFESQGDHDFEPSTRLPRFSAPRRSRHVLSPNYRAHCA
jgi:hypothetical protein